MSFLNESKWSNLTGWRRHQPEPEIKIWLIDAQSLTKRLKAYSKHSFRVQLDSQQWERPLRSERQVLAMPDRGRALVRKVHLLVDETPVVYARTVIPEATLSGKYRGLGHLGCRPLGEVLFADPAMRRESMTFAQIKQGQALYDEAMVDMHQVSDAFWGRRSLFWLKKECLLVSEFFLPNINILENER
ncbi:Chorismate--pyruvate lyase [hydrothermal vent metagenome]|uniref:Chorismate--pyruvate lyase n=1 Tax=hydrothermal vent metagenome TaxID=652676 RepID=A0A3B0Z3S1_9ZZZZ